MAARKRSDNGQTQTVYQDPAGLAKLYGVELRIDVMRNATTNALTALQTASTSTAVTRAGVWTFDYGLNNVHPISSDLADVKNSAQGVGLAYNPGNGEGTFFHQSVLQLINQIKTANASATTQSGKYLMLVSDGYEDSSDVSAAVYPNTNSSGRVQSPIDTDVCDTLKGMGVQIFVLWTEYYPVTDNDWYNTYVAPWNDFDMTVSPPQPKSDNSIESTLRSCASPGNTFFMAQDSTSIQAQMTAMVQAAIASARTRLVK